MTTHANEDPWARFIDDQSHSPQAVEILVRARERYCARIASADPSEHHRILDEEAAAAGKEIVRLTQQTNKMAATIQLRNSRRGRRAANKGKRRSR